MPKNSYDAAFSRSQLRTPLKNSNWKSANTIRSSPSTNGTMYSYRKSRVPFLLDQLPTEVLVSLANNLNFEDAQNFRQLSKKFHTAEKMARNSRKCFSVNLLHHVFPAAYKDWTEQRQHDNGIGILEVHTAMRKLIRSLPFGSITEVDLNGFTAFNMTFFLNFLQAIPTKRLFTNVRHLNIGNCVMEWREVELFGSFIPDLMSIQVSTRYIVLPHESMNVDNINKNNKPINTSPELSAEERNHLESIVVNFPNLIAENTLRQAKQYVTLACAQVSSVGSNVTKRRRLLSNTPFPPRVIIATQQLDDRENHRPSVLRLVALLTQLFPKLELIRLH